MTISALLSCACLAKCGHLDRLDEMANNDALASLKAVALENSFAAPNF
jgi:hypothetical protein